MNLRVEKVREARSGGRALWRLLEPLRFESRLVGEVVVPSGFETDFASVPRVPLAYWLTGDTAHASAVVHDYLVKRLPRTSDGWRLAADVFDEAMRREGVRAWRRMMMKWAVLQADPYRGA